MSYHGFCDDDYKEGQRDYERRGRPDYERDRHFGGEADEAYFEGFNEAKRDEERREEERRQEEHYQEEVQERAREEARQLQLEIDRQEEYNQEQYNQEQEDNYISEQEYAVKFVEAAEIQLIEERLEIGL